MTRLFNSKHERERQFRLLYERNYAPITAYVRRRVNQGDGSEADIVAEVFIVAWRRFPDVPVQPNELPWLYGVARNLVANHFKNVQRSNDLTDRLVIEEGVATDFERDMSDLNGRVRHALAQLSELDREIFRLIHWEELSHEEVGQSLGITAKAVERRVARARRKVRGYLGDYDEPLSPASTTLPTRNTIHHTERTIAS